MWGLFPHQAVLSLPPLGSLERLGIKSSGIHKVGLSAVCKTGKWAEASKARPGGLQGDLNGTQRWCSPWGQGGPQPAAGPPNETFDLIPFPSGEPWPLGLMWPRVDWNAPSCS